MAKAKKKASKAPTKKRAARSKGGERKREGKGTIVFFMGALVRGGYLGEEIPESAGDQSRAAMRLRQMAEKLSRQTRKFGDEDVPLGADD